MTMKRFAYGNATSIEDAVGVMDGFCRPLAGGTDLIAMMKDGLTASERLVAIKTIPGMDHITERKDGWHLGALVTLSSLVADPMLSAQQDMACLVTAAAQSASPQLRHMATLGGNLLQRPRCWYFRNPKVDCWRKGGPRCFAIQGENKYHALLGRNPCVAVHPSDPAVALLALDASVVVVGPHDRRTVPLVDFYRVPARDRQMADGYRPVTDLAPDELVTEVVVPASGASGRSAYVKKMERSAWDFALVSVVASVVQSATGEVSHVRIALGGVASIPWRAHEAEAVLLGHRLSEDVIGLATAAAVADARPLTQNGYKIDLVKAAFREAMQVVVS